MWSDKFRQELLWGKGSDFHSQMLTNRKIQELSVMQVDFGLGPVIRTRLFNLIYLYGGIGFHLLATSSTKNSGVVWYSGDVWQEAVHFDSVSLGLTVPIGIRVDIPKTPLFINAGSNFSFDFVKFAEYGGDPHKMYTALFTHFPEESWTEKQTYKGKDYSMLSIMPYVTIGLNLAFTKP